MKKKNEFYLAPTDKGHWYFLRNEDFPDGVYLPSSTTILEYFPNPGLNHWRENTAPEVIKELQQKGTIQGTKTHHCCYLLTMGEEINPDFGLTKEQISKLPLETSEDKAKDDELLNYLLEPLTTRENRCIKTFKTFWSDYKPVTIAREIKVYNKTLEYAGTLDWVGYLWNAKKKKYELWIIDYKISKQHSKPYESQIVSYDKAMCKMYGKNFRFRLGVLYLGKSTKKGYQLKEIDNKKEAWDNFVYCQKLWNNVNSSAEPKFTEPRDKVKLDNVNYKVRGRTIKLTKQH